MSQQIKTGVGVVIIIIFAITAGFFVWYAQKNQPDNLILKPSQNQQCSQDKSCFLAYAIGGCTACDWANENWKCVSLGEYQKIEEMRQKMFQDPNGPQCELCMPGESPLLFRCVCNDSKCIKTSKCSNDMDCQDTFGGAQNLDYKCINNNCTFNDSKTITAAGQVNLGQQNSIILKKATVVYQQPGQTYFPPYIKEYKNIEIKKGEDFLIEGFAKGTTNVFDLRLKLIDVKDDSIIVEVIYSDYPHKTEEIKKLKNECINASPGMVDATDLFCFDLKTAGDGRLLLEYKAEGYSWMPSP